MKGLANIFDQPGPGEWADCSQAEKILWLAGLQHAVTHADAGVCAAAVVVTREADAVGLACQLRAAALSDMAHGPVVGGRAKG